MPRARAVCHEAAEVVQRAQLGIDRGVAAVPRCRWPRGCRDRPARRRARCWDPCGGCGRSDGSGAGRPRRSPAPRCGAARARRQRRCRAVAGRWWWTGGRTRTRRRTRPRAGPPGPGTRARTGQASRGGRRWPSGLELGRERGADARLAIGRGVAPGRGEVRQALAWSSPRAWGSASRTCSAPSISSEPTSCAAADLLLQLAPPGREPVGPCLDREPPFAEPVERQRARTSGRLRRT